MITKPSPARSLIYVTASEGIEPPVRHTSCLYEARIGESALGL